MNKFYFSRAYIFSAATGRRKSYFFSLVERSGSKVVFQLRDKGNTRTVESTIVVHGDTETATFMWQGIKITLRADQYIPKGYRISAAGQSEKHADQIRDALIRTHHNHNAIKDSKMCYCASCQTIHKPEEVVEYTHNGQTGVCPYCGEAAILCDGDGMPLSNRVLAEVHIRYFNRSNNPRIELTIAPTNKAKPTPCSPYVWVATIQNTPGCGIDVDFYTPEEAPTKFEDFLSKIPSILFRTTFEATECKLHGIEGKEAVDAIIVAIAKYLEDGDDTSEGNGAPRIDVSQFNLKRDVDFALTTTWNGKTTYFTLLADGEIEYPCA